jgi:hypothetical protein
MAPGAVNDMLFDAAYAGTQALDPPLEMYAFDCRPYTYFVWDEDENPTTSQGGSTGPSCPPNTPECTTFRINILPLETQEVDISQFQLPVVDQVIAANGWMMLVFPHSNVWNVPYVDDVYQVYVSTRYDAFGKFSAAMPAALLGNWSCDTGDILPTLHVGQYTYVQ